MLYVCSTVDQYDGVSHTCIFKNQNPNVLAMNGSITYNVLMQNSPLGEQT